MNLTDMDKDYKDRIPGGASGGQAPPGWLWFLTGVLAGGFAAGLVCLNRTGGMQPPPPALVPQVVQPPPEEKPKPPPKPLVVTPPAPPPQVKPPVVAAAQSPTPAAVPDPRFDFYTILPEKEEVVTAEQRKPLERPQTPPALAAPNEQAAAEGAPSYMLQLGSFKRLEDAERRRAELATHTILAEIQTVTINDGEVYHRVRSGPYSSEDAGLLGERLRTMNINSLTIRLRKD